MIAIKSWIERLIERCAKTNEKNTYTATQRFSDCIESKNSTFNSKTPPTANNSGVSNRIIFLDKNERHLGSIDVFRTLSDSRGIRFTVGSNHLGFQLSDEGIATSFVNHPYEPGPDNQIATVKYVDDKDSGLAEEIKKLIDLTRLHSDQIAEILLHLSAINELILNIDELPTEGSKNLVYSGGVYSYLHDNLEEIKKSLTQYILQLIEENRLSGLTFTRSVVRETDFTWSTENFDETYTATNTGFLVLQTSTKRWWEVHENDKIIAGGGGDGYGVHEALRTIPVRANKKYRIKGKVGNVAFYYLSYKLGD